MNNKIDITKWKKFSYDNFFELISTHKKLTNKDLSDNGNIPVYSSSTVNNGLFGYTEEKPQYLISNDIPLYIIFGDHTKAMFIIRKDFCIMDNVKVLIPKLNNEYCIRFITTVWKQIIPNIGYARHWAIAKNTLIPLPVDNNDVPDWKYMEQYMKKIESKSLKLLERLHNTKDLNNKIDIKEWKDFEVGELFEISTPKVYHAREVKEDIDGIPYVVRSKFNNGIKYNVKQEKNFILNPSNVISFGAENAAFFYQEKEYISGRDMYYIDTRNITKNASLFIITCLEKLTNKYSYNFGLFPNLLRKEKIKLPVNKDGNPDYEYMDKYMEILMNEIKPKLKILKNV